MPTRVQVQCINKTDRHDPHDRIKAIGGLNADGGRWKLAQEAAISGIENGKNDFFVRVGGREVDVIVGERLGRKYLKTRSDGEQPNNLLSLPECP